MDRLEVQVRHQHPSGFRLDVQFQSDAKVLSLFGPSGSGKTTLLSVIGGFLRPDEARVCQGTSTLVDTKQGILIPPEHRRVGFVFQDHLLFPHLSVERNLTYGRRQVRSARIPFQRVIDILELGPLLAQMPRTLSGGQQQRVALGRAILSEPELLLMDEPLRSLDEALRSRILAYLEPVLAEWNIQTIYVSHNQMEVRRLATWTVVLDQGRVVDQGPTEEVIEHPTLLDRQGEMGPVNILRVTEVHQDSAGTWHGWVQQQQLDLPPPATSIASGLVTFAPTVVSILISDAGTGSARNRLMGRIRHLHPLADRVLVGIDVGPLLWAEITPDSCRELGLAIDREVSCSIKVRSMTWIS